MKKILVFMVLSAAFLLQFCSPGKKATAPPSVAVAKITFDGSVKPLINEKCGPCHTMGNKSHIGEFSIAVSEADDMIRRIQLKPEENGFMPFKHDKLSDSAINVFVAWKAGGLLEKAP